MENRELEIGKEKTLKITNVEDCCKHSVNPVHRARSGDLQVAIVWQPKGCRYERTGLPNAYRSLKSVKDQMFNFKEMI